MEREQLDRLLAEYASGGLSEPDKKILFTAALADQELFDQLAEEDSLREAIELPGARNRLIDSLQEDAVPRLAETAPASAVLRMPAPAPKAAPPSRDSRAVWYAWAAGIGVVFVSGAITLMMFEGTTLKDLAQVNSSAPKDKKPFVAPPGPADKARPVIVEEPPKIVAENRGPVSAPKPINMPLPSAPPPLEVVALKDAKAGEPVLSARAQRDRTDMAYRANQQTQMPLVAPAQQQPAAAVAAPRRQVATENVTGGRVAGADEKRVVKEEEAGSVKAAKPAAPPPRPATMVGLSGGGSAIGSGTKAPAERSELAREAKAKLSAESVAPTLWRRAGDGVWIRVPAGDAVGRNDSVVVRYVPASSTNIALVDPAGRRVTNRTGRPGEELELPVPAVVLKRAEGDSLTLSITEGTRSTPLKILLRRE